MCLDKILRLNTMLMHVTEPDVIFLDKLDCSLGLEYPKVFAISLVLKQLAIWRGYALFAVFLFNPGFPGKSFVLLNLEEAICRFIFSLRKNKLHFISNFK